MKTAIKPLILFITLLPFLASAKDQIRCVNIKSGDREAKYPNGKAVYDSFGNSYYPNGLRTNDSIIGLVYPNGKRVNSAFAAKFLYPDGNIRQNVEDETRISIHDKVDIQYQGKDFIVKWSYPAYVIDIFVNYSSSTISSVTCALRK